MADKRPREPMPGNDGRWFLELVGVVEPEPESTDTYATLQRLVPPPTSDDSATVAASSAASSANGALETDPSPNGAPPGSHETVERRFRGWWIIGVVVLLIGGAVAAGALLLPDAADAEAAAAAAEHRTALVALRNELPATQAALADLTDPASSPDTVSAVPLALGDLNATAGQAIAVATAPLPSTLPLVPRDRFDALGPTRAAMVVLAGEAGDLTGELGIAFTYRSTIESLFAVGALPVQLDEDAITELSVELAGDLANTGRAVAELPFEPRFAEAHELANAASERYATWQLEYLDALHEGDAGRAEALIAELAGTVDRLRAAEEEAMASLRTDLDAEILQLAAELETAIDAVP